jgi:hypothetical protein
MQNLSKRFPISRKRFIFVNIHLVFENIGAFNKIKPILDRDCYNLPQQSTIFEDQQQIAFKYENIVQKLPKNTIFSSVLKIFSKIRH